MTANSRIRIICGNISGGRYEVASELRTLGYTILEFDGLRKTFFPHFEWSGAWDKESPLHEQYKHYMKFLCHMADIMRNDESMGRYLILDICDPFGAGINVQSSNEVAYICTPHSEQAEWLMKKNDFHSLRAALAYARKHSVMVEKAEYTFRSVKEAVDTIVRSWELKPPVRTAYD